MFHCLFKHPCFQHYTTMPLESQNVGNYAMRMTEILRIKDGDSWYLRNVGMARIISTAQGPETRIMKRKSMVNA